MEVLIFDLRLVFLVDRIYILMEYKSPSELNSAARSTISVFEQVRP